MNDDISEIFSGGKGGGGGLIFRNGGWGSIIMSGIIQMSRKIYRKRT